MTLHDTAKEITRYKKDKKAAFHPGRERVTVYEMPERGGLPKEVARVRCNNALDQKHADGFYHDKPGKHLGITRLADGRYALLYVSDEESLWLGAPDRGEVVSDKVALETIRKTGNMYLLADKKFLSLREQYVSETATWWETLKEIDGKKLQELLGER